MKYCSIDLETTGLDVDNCDILEFGAVLDDLKNKQPLKSLPRFHCYFIMPNNIYKGEPRAMAMHSKIFDRIDSREEGYTYMSPMKLGYAFKSFLINNNYETQKDKVTINVAGKNFAAFDLQFLNRYTDLNKHVKIRHRIIDPAMLFIENGDDRLPSLSDCKKRAGLPEEVAHNAIDDAIDVIKIVREGLAYKFM